MRFLRSERVIQFRSKESVLVLRVRNFFLPVKSHKFLASAAAHRLDQPGVSVTGEVLKGCSLAILFAHEKQRDARRENSDSCSELKPLKVHQGAQPFARSSISYLIVILVANHEMAG